MRTVINQNSDKSENIEIICCILYSLCEDFHNALNSLFHCNRPSTWNLLEELDRYRLSKTIILANAQIGRPEI